MLLTLKQAQAEPFCMIAPGFKALAMSLATEFTISVMKEASRAKEGDAALKVHAHARAHARALDMHVPVSCVHPADPHARARVLPALQDDETLTLQEGDTLTFLGAWSRMVAQLLSVDFSAIASLTLGEHKRINAKISSMNPVDWRVKPEPVAHAQQSPPFPPRSHSPLSIPGSQPPFPPRLPSPFPSSAPPPASRARNSPARVVP